MAISPYAFWSGVLAVLKAFVFLVGFVVISTPIEGIFARWRATYSPKVVQLEGAEEDANTKKVNNVFQMLGRVYKVEGVVGLYKGIMPNIIAFAAINIWTLVAHLAGLSIDDFIRLRWHFDSKVAFYLFEVFSRSVRVAVFVVPALIFTILYYRVVTTPLVLPVHKPVLALRLLFTPEELRAPWKLYTPALIATHAFPIAWTIEVLQRMQKILPPFDNSHTEYVWWRVVLAIVTITVALVVFPVLEVVKAKLSVQKIGATHTALPTEERETQPVVAEYPEEVVG
ncbi:hypothetical protein FIBSPDRAFT_870562, partial [Athelia psychrophila]